MTAVLATSIGPDTVDNWLALDPPDDGSRLELIMGYFHVVPPPSVRHQYYGDGLRTMLQTTLRSSGRTDCYAVTAVGVQLSTAWRTAVIPDVVVLNRWPGDVTCQPEDLELVVEIWSPGNTNSERETKRAAYAGAGVPFFWTVEFDKHGRPTIQPYRLEHGDYVAEKPVTGGASATVTAAPVPITLDPADLLP